MQGRPIAEAVEALIDTSWAVKTERVELTQALYRCVAELESDALRHAFAARVDKATMELFRSDCDIASPDAGEMNLLSTT